MSYKIIRVLNGVVSIASSDGTFFNVPIEELDFEPKVGDEVQCFRNGEKVIVFKNENSLYKQNQIPGTVPKNESSSNLHASVEVSAVPKTGLQGFEQNTPIGNPLADELVEKKSRLPWIIGIILLLLGILLGCIYLNNNNGGVMTDSRDGKKYKTVKIGSQIWMAENLAYETPYSWDIVSEKTGRHYGRAYPWQVALKACPEGWHLPSGKEFLNLLEFLGGRDNSETGKKLLPRTFFGRLNVTGFDAQMVGNHFFHMIYPNRRRYSFDDCYRSRHCKNLNPDDEYIDENEEKDAVFWTSDLDDGCPYDVGCGPLPKLGTYLRIDSSGNANVWSGFGDGGDWIGTPIRCIQN